MYVYQLLSVKSWQQQQEAYQLAREAGQGYLPKPKRISTFMIRAMMTLLND